MSARRAPLALKPGSAALASVERCLHDAQLGPPPAPHALQPHPHPSPPSRALPAAASLASLRSPLAPAPAPAPAAAHFDTLDKRRYVARAHTRVELSQERLAAAAAEAAAAEARAEARAEAQLAAVQRRNRAAKERLLRYALLFQGGSSSSSAELSAEGLAAFEGMRMDEQLLARVALLEEARARRIIRWGLCRHWRRVCEVRRQLNA